MNSTDKLDFYLKSKNIKRRDAAKDLDLNYTALNNYFMRGFVSDFLKKIISAYPDIDLNWLLKNESTQIEESNARVKTKEELINEVRINLKKLEQL